MGGDTITVKTVGWSEVAREHLCQVVDWPDHLSPDYFRNALDHGQIFALGVFSKGVQIGTTFYKFEQGDMGKEFVIMASAGHLPGVDLVAVVLPFMEALAIDAGCLSMAFFTSRPGLVRKSAKQGFDIGQTVMRKSLGKG